MSYLNYITLSGEGRQDIVGGDPVYAEFLPTTIPTRLKVPGSVDPPRLKYAGWWAIGHYAWGSTEVDVWYDPHWINFGRQVWYPPGEPFVGEVRWQLDPGFSGTLLVVTNS